jgi:uncharacterized membrane protein required for colicin V production
MNWSDYIVLGVIFVFAIVGLINGFVFSIFKIASFFLSIYISVKFYPAAADMLAKTPLYDAVKSSVLKSLTARGQEAAAASGGQQAGTAAEAVIGGLQLPGVFKKALIDRVPDTEQLVDMNGIMNTISEELTRIIISVLSLILLYVLVRIAIMIVGYILKGITKLPVVKQLDRLGGLALGAAQGLLTVYIICAVLMLFNTVPQFGQVFTSLENSMLAKFFYENNFIVNFMFPAGRG